MNFYLLSEVATTRCSSVRCLYEKQSVVDILKLLNTEVLSRLQPLWFLPFGGFAETRTRALTYFEPTCRIIDILKFFLELSTMVKQSGTSAVSKNSLFFEVFVVFLSFWDGYYGLKVRVSPAFSPSPHPNDRTSIAFIVNSISMD